MATSSDGSTGFDTCTWKPARSARVRSSERANAVSAIAGILPPRASPSARTRREQLVAVDAGHADVADQHVRALALEQRQRLGGSRRRAHLGARNRPAPA